MNRKSITLIRPNMGAYRSTDALPSLAMAIIAARTPEHFDVSFYDDRIEDLPKDNPDLVAITVETFTALRAYEIADTYRTRSIPVVLGGYHPTFLPEEALLHSDTVVVGDAEGVWEQLLDDRFNKNEIKTIYRSDNMREMTDVILNRGIFTNKKYPPIHLVWFSRGCRFACDFCSIRAFYKEGVRFRPAEDVIKEVHKLGSRKSMVFFVDDNLFVSKEGFNSLLDALEKTNIRWSCQISIDIARDDKILDRMARSGCVLVLIGFESLSPTSLIQMGKKWNKVSGEYRDVVKKFHNRGIAVYGTFVFGYDGDTIETIEETLQFAMDARLEIANFNPLTPTPGSPLYDRLLVEKRLIKEKWWIDPTYRYGDAIFMPMKMDPTEFSEKCFEVKKRFYSATSIASRLLFGESGFDWYRTGVMGIANIVSRREILRKQHHLLGR